MTIRKFNQKTIDITPARIKQLHDEGYKYIMHYISNDMIRTDSVFKLESDALRAFDTDSSAIKPSDHNSGLVLCEIRADNLKWIKTY